MNKISLIAICFLATGHLEAADGLLRLFPETGAKIHVSGQNTVHQWMIHGSEIGGWVEFAPGLLDGSDQTSSTKRADVRCDLTIPVRSLNTYGGLTASMRQLLKEAEHPQIVLRFQEALVQTTRVGPELVYRVRAEARLTVAGVTKDLAIPIDVFPLGGQRFRLAGKTGFKMSNHSIEPPVLRTSGGDVKYRDDLEASFEVTVGPKSNDRKLDD